MIDLEMLEKTIVLMKKYGLQRLENNDLRLEMQWGQLQAVGPAPAPGLFDGPEHTEYLKTIDNAQRASAMALQEKLLASSDEDILMNPYHGLDDLELLDHSHNKEKGK